jgi:hypothetical protein
VLLFAFLIALTLANNNVILKENKLKAVECQLILNIFGVVLPPDLYPAF